VDIFNIIADQLNNQDTLSKLGQSVGADPAQVQKVAQLGMPAILQALQRNSSTDDGANALAGALDQHQGDNVSDISGFLDNVNTEDGMRMLQHIFSGNNDRVQNNLAQQSGLDTGQVSGLLSHLAPLVMGALSQQKQQQNLGSADMNGLLNGILGNSSNSGIMGLVSNLLDSDHDGSIIDDVGGLLGKFLKK